MKKKLRSIMALVLGGMMIVGATGCSSSGSASSSASGSGSTSSSASAENKTSGDPIVLKLTYENNPDEPIDKGAQKWAELVSERTNGEVEIQIFPSSQLGNKRDLIEQMRLGENIITIADGSYLMDFVPDFGVVMGPCLMDNYDQMFKLTASDWWKEQSDALTDSGLKIISNNWIYGDRHLLTKKEVKTPADLKGMKIRVPNNDISVKMFNMLGASSTPMALSDVYTSLQQGVVDGVENPLTVLYANKFQEVCKNLTLTEHQKTFSCFITSNDFFNTLTEEQQQIIMEAGDEAALYNNECYDELTAEMIDKFKEAGVNIIELENTDEFKDLVKPLYEEYESNGTWTPGLYDKIQEIIAE